MTYELVKTDGKSIDTVVFNPNNSDKSLIIVPGLGRAGNHYRGYAEYLSSDYRVITYDPRSHGKNNGHYDFEGMVNDLSAVIDHFAQDSDQLKVVGHSNGAFTALFAANNPNISQLDLVSLPYSLKDPYSVKLMLALNLHKLSHKQFKLIVDSTGLLAIPYLFFKGKLKDSFFYQNLFDLEKPIKAGDLYISDWSTHTSNISHTPAISDVESKIETPTRFIFGGEDRILHINSNGTNKVPERYLQVFDNFENYELVVVPKASHSFKIKKTHDRNYDEWLEQTKALANLILEYKKK